MSSTTRARSSTLLASLSNPVRGDVSPLELPRARQESPTSAFAAQRMRDTFDPGRSAVSGSGACLPSSASPSLPDLSMLSNLFSMMEGLLGNLSSLFGSSQADACAPRSASPDNCRPAPSSDNCRPAPSSDNCRPSSPDNCRPSPDNCEPSPSAPGGKTWDVFFDAKQGTKTKQKSPIVLDLNGNGRPDITGGNIQGNGKLEGQTVKGFDLDPNARQWESKSQARRPGQGAPKLPPGTTMQVFDSSGKALGERPITGGGKGKNHNMGLAKGERAEFRDKDGKLVGELKPDGKKGTMMYFWGNKNENEWTKPWDANGGDGILAWDQDGDGKITSSKELFGEWDVDGQKKFTNGYQKLAAHFDKDGNGVVEGDELKGLKVWEDRNGDGVTQDGELVDLASRGIKSLNVKFDPNDMSSSFNKA